MSALMDVLLADQQNLRNESTLRSIESSRIDPPEDPLEDWEVAMTIASARTELDSAEDYLTRAVSARTIDDQADEIKSAEKCMTDAGLCLLGNRVEELVGALREVTKRLMPVTEGDLIAIRNARGAARALGMTL